MVCGEPLELQFESELRSRCIGADMPSTLLAFAVDPITGAEIRLLISDSLPSHPNDPGRICIATWVEFFLWEGFRLLMLPSLSFNDDGGGGACRDGIIVLGPRLICSGSCTMDAVVFVCSVGSSLMVPRWASSSA